MLGVVFALVGTGALAEQTLFPLQRTLAPVRENLQLLGRAAVVFVGRFHGRVDDDWVSALCREKRLAEIGDRFVFVRHARRRVLDADELWLRERGVPRGYAFEGVLVVDQTGETVTLLRRPIDPKRFHEALERALSAGRGGEAENANRRFRHTGPPGYAFMVPEGLRAIAVGEPDADLRLLDDALGAELRVRAERVGPAGARGEGAALDAIARRRAVLFAEQPTCRRRWLKVRGKSLEVWAYEEREDSAKGAERKPWRVLEVRWPRGGDVFTVRIRSRRAGDEALARRLEQVVAALLEGAS